MADRDALLAELAELQKQLSRARAEVRAARSQQEAILNASPSGVILVGRDGNLLAVSPAVRATLPVIPHPVGRPLKQAIPYAPLADLIDRCVTDRVSVAEEARCGRFDLLLTANPVGEHAGAMAVVSDVTSLKRAERQRSEFVANASHELRTPITSILGFTETLMADPDVSEDQLEMLATVERNARRLDGMVTGLIHLSRVEGRFGELALAPYELKGLSKQVLELRYDVAAMQEQELELVADGPVTVLIDAEAWHHILGNLVDNALRYTPEGGSIRVLVAVEGDRAVVEVSDTGIGIEPSHQQRVFERFYRVDSGRSRDTGGTGLGLAIVKHYCKAIGAEITLRSLPGRGSRFKIRIPLAPVESLP